MEDKSIHIEEIQFNNNVIPAPTTTTTTTTELIPLPPVIIDE